MTSRGWARTLVGDFPSSLPRGPALRGLASRCCLAWRARMDDLPMASTHTAQAERHARHGSDSHPSFLYFCSEHVSGWGNGGLCSNYGAILSYTNWHGGNHVWARYGVFHWNPHHHFTGWHCHWWWWYCWRYHYQHCHIYNGAGTTAIYACRM